MKSYWGTRLWIRISSLFGIAMVVFMLGGYFYLINQYQNGVRNKDLDSVIIKNANDLVQGPGILMLFLIWATVKTLVCNIGLIKFAGEEDSVFLANKWTLIVLSLSIGGFFAPWSMSRLPNVNVKATRNARVTIVKYMGFSWAISGLITSIVFAVLKTRFTGSNAVFTGDSSKYFALIVSINAVLFVINFIPFLMFNIKPASNILNAKEPGYKKYEIITTMYIFVVTIQLIVLIISACLRTLMDFLRAAEGQDAFERIFNVINAIFSLIYTIYLIKIITSTIKGLWRKEDYMIEIPVYNKLNNYNKNKGIK